MKWKLAWLLVFSGIVISGGTPRVSQAQQLLEIPRAHNPPDPDGKDRCRLADPTVTEQFFTVSKTIFCAGNGETECELQWRKFALGDNFELKEPSVTALTRQARKIFQQEYENLAFLKLEVPDAAATEEQIKAMERTNANTALKNKETVKKYYRDQFFRADLLYRLGGLYREWVRKSKPNGVVPEQFVCAEWLFAAAAGAKHAGALFDLAALYSSKAGTMESRNTAINLFYSAGLAYLEPPENLAGASEAVEGIIRIEKEHALAKRLNCLLLGFSFSATSPECAAIVKTPLEGAKPPAPDGQPPPAGKAPPEQTIKFPLVNTTFLNLLSKRETAKTAYILAEGMQFVFGSTGDTAREKGLLRELESGEFTALTIGFDFTDQLSMAYSTNLFFKGNGLQDLKDNTFNLENDPSNTTADFPVGKAQFKFQQLTLYYYPHRYFYLGISTLLGNLELKEKLESVEGEPPGESRLENFAVFDNLVVFGILWEVGDPEYWYSRDPLTIEKNSTAFLMGLRFSIPVNSSQSILESALSFGMGMRFK